MAEVNVLGFAGSLRKESFNRKLLRASAQLAPEGMTIEAFDISDIPLYNTDVEQAAFPDSVRRFKEAIRAADGVLIVTPEHNYSFAGVTKNAIDWASRPYGDSAFKGKPVIIQSASPGYMGGARAQYHLRQVFGYLEMKQMFFPEVFLSAAQKAFDAEGNLTSEMARENIVKQLEAFKKFIQDEAA
ncbi:MAG TPA: NADPH-dependent FMN reductase [Fimbriimonadaceae bacterium]|nr:NADPH-dependent FMN reductase [Fimbriimonadaceae bacterium]